MIYLILKYRETQICLNLNVKYFLYVIEFSQFYQITTLNCNIMYINLIL